MICNLNESPLEPREINMTSDNELQKVKAFKFPKIGKYTAKVIFSSLFFTWFGTVCGMFLSYKTLYSDISINTNIIFLLICGGSAIGFYIGNLFSKYIKKKTELFYAMFSISVVPLVFLQLSGTLYKIFKDHLNEDTTLLIFGIPIILGMPIFMYIVLIKTVYCCEKCKQSYEQITVFASKIASPYKVLSLLQNKQEFPNVLDLEEDKSFPKYKKDNIQIAVNAYYCPLCYDAIIEASLIYEVGFFGKEKRAILFYSDFWTGELFRKVFSIENTTIKTKESEINHHHKPTKLITSTEFFYSKLKLCKLLFLFMMPIIMSSYGLIELINTLAVEPPTKKIEVILICSFFICVFGIFFIITVLKLFDNKPKVIINSIGVEDYNFKLGMIYWQDIKKIFVLQQVNNYQSYEFIYITLVKPEKYYKTPKLKKIMISNRKKEFYDIALQFTLLKPSVNEAWEYISQLCESKHYMRNNANPNEYIKPESN